jgi:3-phosphoshikimate 1-carboxyvinyltransferase
VTAYPTELTLDPIHALEGVMDLPGSKSITNRALLLAALASGTSVLRNVLASDDTRYMIDALRALGVSVREHGTEVEVTGCAGPLVTRPGRWTLFLGLAGTAYRPLTAALTLGSGEFVLDGSARMHERPIADLVDGLAQLGARIRYLGTPGFPPVEVLGTGLDGGSVDMRGDVSSQFLTSLLLSAPLARGPVTVAIEGEQVSTPYLDITVHMMRAFGATLDHEGHRRYHVLPSGYVSPGVYHVEGDASSASYFLAAGAIRGRGVVVRGVGRQSVQGDVAFATALEQMGARVAWGEDQITVAPPVSGVLKALDVDLNHIPDAAMTLAVLALFARGTTCIRNVGNWRVKETDRLHAMATELRRVGAIVEEGSDFICVTPPEALKHAVIETYGDHRMAMCFSLVALSGTKVTLRDPGCVAKTFPDYFERFGALSVPA